MIKNRLKKMLWNLKHRPFRYSKKFLALSDLVGYDDRERFLEKVMDYARSSRLEGDYLEFGVFEGHTFITSFHLAQAQGKNLKSMRFIAFDSFEGLPKIKGVDRSGFEHFSAGDYTCSLKNFVRNLKSSKVDLCRTRVVPGWFEDTLNNDTKKRLGVRKASIVYVDCDLYNSAMCVLDFIKDVLEDGSVLIFDDWFTFRGSPEQGEQKAFKEWLEKNPEIQPIEYLKFGWYGNSFIIRIKK